MNGWMCMYGIVWYTYVCMCIVKPKKGKALLWPSTLSEDPERQDMRTMHEARPVVKGIKFAANSWIHLYNFVQPNLWGCTGTFDEY